MLSQNITVNPASPQIGMDDPKFPTTSNSHKPDENGNKDGGSAESQEQQHLLSPLPHQRPAFLRQRKKISTGSTNTSIDTDDDLQNSNEFEFSNASLSDSQTHRNNQERLQILSPNRFKKLKKKNRLTQIISGANYRSKSELFQKLFKNLNPNEQLIIDYSCAFHRDILVHGRLYLSQNWLCFYANIFGWETLITVQWTDITAITKEKTAKVIPNAIQVLTDTEKYFFTTFVTRENAYTALFRIWQNALLGHPMPPNELKTVCRKYRQKKGMDTVDAIEGDPINDFLDETGDEVAEDDLASTNGSNERLNKIGADDATSENLETNGSISSQSLQVNVQPSSDVFEESGEVPKEDSLQQPPPTPVETSSVADVNVNERDDREETERKHTFLNGHISQEEAKEKIKNAFKHGIPNMTTRSFSKASDLFRKKKKPKNRHHHHSIHLTVPDDAGETTTDFEEEGSDASTDNRLDEDVLCPCHDSHTGTEYINEEFNLDVDALYAHMFSQESDLMKRVFAERKHMDWRYTPLVKDEEGNETQTLTYTLNLNYSIGPKTSETISKMTISKDNKPGTFYIVTTENRSVGVPYSDSFHAAVRYCLTRLSGNRSRLKVFGDIVYTKRVFGLVKNMISRNGDEAMRDYYVYLVDVLKSESEAIPVSGVLNKRKPKKKTVKKPGKESVETIQRKPSYGPQVPATKVSQPENTSIFADQSISNKALIGICIVVFMLLGMNIYLLRRLGSLEGAVLFSKSKWVPKELPNTKEEWKNLLEYQKNLHDLEILKLKEVIGNTAVLIKQVEGSISSLYSELVKNGESNQLPESTATIQDGTTGRSKEDL